MAGDRATGWHDLLPLSALKAELFTTFLKLG